MHSGCLGCPREEPAICQMSIEDCVEHSDGDQPVRSMFVPIGPVLNAHEPPMSKLMCHESDQLLAGVDDCLPKMDERAASYASLFVAGGKGNCVGRLAGILARLLEFLVVLEEKCRQSCVLNVQEEDVPKFTNIQRYK